MIRIHTNFARLVLTSLLYCKEGGADPKKMKDWVYKKYKGMSSGKERNPYGVAIADDHPQESIQDLIEMLAEQIPQARDVVNDGPLIDTVVRLLQLPWGRNTLSGRTIEQLRRAVLLPDEMARLSDTIRKVEFNCATCQHPFEDGEVLTYSTRDGSPCILCIKCRIPLKKPCGQCKEGTVEIDKRTWKGLEKGVTCSLHGPNGEMLDPPVIQEAPRVNRPRPRPLQAIAFDDTPVRATNVITPETLGTWGNVEAAPAVVPPPTQADWGDALRRAADTERARQQLDAIRQAERTTWEANHRAVENAIWGGNDTTGGGTNR